VIDQPDFNEFVLDPATVAEAVVEQVMSGYGGQLILPARLGFASIMRGIPMWMQESARNSVANVLKNRA
jgi:all-trans-retinol dehydrogenase (NAD+)